MQLIFSEKKFTVRKEVLDWQQTLLTSIGRDYVFQTYLKDRMDHTFELPLKLSMAHIHDAVFLDFIMKWSMIFGNPNSQKAHWNHIFVKKNKNVEKQKQRDLSSFKHNVMNYILSEIGGRSNEYDEARTSVVARNRYVAHVDIGKVPPMPGLDKPYSIAKAYSKLIHSIEATEPTGFYLISEQEEFYQEEAMLLFPM